MQDNTLRCNLYECEPYETKNAIFPLSFSVLKIDETIPKAVQ